MRSEPEKMKSYFGKAPFQLENAQFPFGKVPF
jgi:hypothetical protein